MFSGIIEEVGKVIANQQQGEKRRLTVGCSKLLPELKRGDSVAVSGVCLTAVDITNHSFTADLAQETWRRTSFSRLKEGAIVNLELPMRANGRFDGHIVQGHVDGTGTMVSLSPIEGGNDFLLTIRVPSELTRYIVAKGSLSIEGISLTVASLESDTLGVTIIPHTYEATALRERQVGDAVNLETDLLGKYVARFMVPGS